MAKFTRQHIYDTAKELSNWGRWGENDQFGTLNNVTPEDIVNAGKLIKKGKVFTPKTHSILNGITRRAVIEIAKKNKIKLVQGDYRLNDILTSDGVFLTGTAAEIQQVNKIKNKIVGTKSLIIKRIVSEYKELIKKNLKNLNKISKL